MSISTDLLPIIGSAAAATGIAAVLSQLMRPLLLDQKDRREKSRNKLKDQIKKKLQGGIVLDASEITDIGRGLRLSAAQSTEVLYELYSEAEEQEQHAHFKALLAEINRAEPFEALPEEVRPSLARLSIICQETAQSSDKELLHPLTKVLGEYQEMKRDHASIKKQSRVSYVIALISFFVGIVGLLLAFSGPSKQFISQELNKSTTAIQKQIESAQEANQADGK